MTMKGSNMPTRAEQAELARVVGLRLKEAREAVGMSQLDAAKQLGYANSTKLSKIESGKHSSQILMWVLIRAAELYDVSLDYLVGYEAGAGEDCSTKEKSAADFWQGLYAATTCCSMRDMEHEVNEGRLRMEQVADNARLMSAALSEAEAAGAVVGIDDARRKLATLNVMIRQSAREPAPRAVYGIDELLTELKSF